MAGFVPDEGEAAILDLVCKRYLLDRDANLELGLFTNVSVTETTTHAALTEPAGTGYARIDLTDASWTGAADTRAYAQQTFTGGAGNWTGTVQGYFIATKASGGTKRLLFLEIDAAGPWQINNGDTYKVTPNFTAA